MRPPQGKDTTVTDIFHEKNVVLRKLEKTMCLQHYLFLLALKASILITETSFIYLSETLLKY